MTYVVGIKGGDNDGSRRGSIVHKVFECLLKSRHKKHYDLIMEKGSAFKSAVVVRLIAKMARSMNLSEYDDKGNHNIELIDSMIMIGLSCDFYCKGQELEKAEAEFYYEGSNYIIRGALDKIAKGERYTIFDYKSSERKYVGEDEEFNVQSLMYSLWFYRERKAIPFFRFIFLRFKDDPYIDKEFTEEQIKGFEDYLVYISDYLQHFNYQKAVSNLAATKGYPKDGSFSGMLACGYGKYPGHIKPTTGKPYYICAFKHPKKFYFIKDYNGDVKYTTDNTHDIILENGDSFEEFSYGGCPHWYPNAYE